MSVEIDYSKWDPEMAARIKALMEEDNSDSQTEAKPDLNNEAYLQALRQEAQSWNWKGFVDGINGMFAQLSLGDISDVRYYVSYNLADALGGRDYHNNKIFEDFYFDIPFEGYDKKNFAGLLTETVQNNKENIKSVLSGVLKLLSLDEVVSGGKKLNDLIQKINPEYTFADDTRQKKEKTVKAVRYADSRFHGFLKSLGDPNKFAVYKDELSKMVSDSNKEIIKSRIICDDDSIDVALDTLTQMNEILAKMGAEARQNKSIDPTKYNYMEPKFGSSEIIKDLNGAIESFNLCLTDRFHNEAPRRSKEHKQEKELRLNKLRNFLGKLANEYKEAKDPKKIARVSGVSENTLCRLYIKVLKHVHMYLPGINPYKRSMYSGIKTKEQIIKKVKELKKNSEINSVSERMLVIFYLFLKAWGEEGREKLEKALNDFYRMWSRQKFKHPKATIFKLKSLMQVVTNNVLDLLQK